MYLALTRDFFLSQKGRFIVAVVSVAFLIGSYLFMNAAMGVDKTGRGVPDLVYTNKVIDAYQWAYLEDLPGDFVHEFQRRAAGKAEAFPVTQRFLMNVMNLYGDFRFHMFGVPQDFMDRQLAGLVLAGRVPRPGEAGLVVGNSAALRWELSVGDVFTATLAADPAAGAIPYTVTGVLDPNAMDYFDRGLFASSESFEALTGKTVAANSLFIFLKPGVDPEDIGTLPGEIPGGRSLAAIRLKSPGFQQKARLISGIVLIGLCSLSLFQSIQVILNNSAKRVGLLKALGMPDLHVALIFAQGVLAVFALATLLGVGLASGIFLYLNREIGKMLMAPVQIYRLTWAAVLTLLAMLAGALAIVIAGVLYRTRRVPPRKAMLEI